MTTTRPSRELFWLEAYNAAYDQLVREGCTHPTLLVAAAENRANLETAKLYDAAA